MEQANQSCRGFCSKSILKLDPFSQEVEILFENNRRKLQTHCGVVFCFIMVSILISFAGFKSVQMFEYRYVHLQEPLYDDHFEPEYVFKPQEIGFKLAFGVIAYDNTSS